MRQKRILKIRDIPYWNEMNEVQIRHMERVVYFGFFIAGLNTGAALISTVLIVLLLR